MSRPSWTARSMRLPARAVPPALRQRLEALVNPASSTSAPELPGGIAVPKKEGRRGSTWAASFVSACAAAALVLVVIRLAAPRPPAGGPSAARRRGRQRSHSRRQQHASGRHRERRHPSGQALVHRAARLRAARRVLGRRRLPAGRRQRRATSAIARRRCSCSSGACTRSRCWCFRPKGWPGRRRACRGRPAVGLAKRTRAASRSCSGATAGSATRWSRTSTCADLEALAAKLNGG